jgi:hypothetical protein
MIFTPFTTGKDFFLNPTPKAIKRWLILFESVELTKDAEKRPRHRYKLENTKEKKQVLYLMLEQQNDIPVDNVNSK